MTMTKHASRVAVALALATVPVNVSASECDDPQASWLLCEDFEQGESGWEAWYAQSPWVECDGCSGGVNNPARIRLEQDAATAHDGQWSLHMPGEASAGYQGGTLRFASCDGEQQAGCTLQGYDRLYFRTWVRLAANHDYVHHFLGLGGSRPNEYWDANGNAGCRPNGERWAGTRVDLNSDHELFFYTYFPDMNCDSGGYCSGAYAQNICDGCAGIDMPCTDGLECCWGNHFAPRPPVTVPTEEWTCIEMMMELNTPGAADGSMAFWVDDELAHEVTGMHWRDVPELQLNRAMLEHYIASGDTDHENPVWFDDVIVSTERIGCVSTPGGDDGGGDTGGETGASSGDDDGGGDSGDDATSGPAASGSQSGGAGDATGSDSSDLPAGMTGGATESAGETGDTMPGSDEAIGGCGCRSTGEDLGLGGLGLFMLAAARRRRNPRT